MLLIIVKISFDRPSNIIYRTILGYIMLCYPSNQRLWTVDIDS